MPHKEASLWYQSQVVALRVGYFHLPHAPLTWGGRSMDSRSNSLGNWANVRLYRSLAAIPATAR
jgi:hypothetical protein